MTKHVDSPPPSGQTEALPAASSSVPPTSLSPGDERTWAMLAHLSVFLNLLSGFGGPIAALVIYLVFKDRSRYVAYHSLQALVFQLIWWAGGSALAGIAWVISGILSFILIGILFMPLAFLLSCLPIAALVYGVIGAIQTSQGQDFKYWLIGDWVRGTLTG